MSILSVTHTSNSHLHGHTHALEENYLGKVVEWIRKDRAIHEQLLAYTMVAIGVIFLIILFPIGIPVLIGLYSEYDMQDLQSKVNTSDEEIYKIFGGKESVETMPRRKIENLNWDTFNELPSHTMRDSVEKTKDTFERPGFLLRLLDHRTKRIFVQAVYRKYMYEPVWDYSRSANSPFEGRRMDDQDLLRLQLIVNGRHKHYSLA